MYPGRVVPRSARATKTFVVDATPEVRVVGGVRDRNSLARVVVVNHTTSELQLFGVNVQTVDVVEDALGVVDDPARGGAVAVP